MAIAGKRFGSMESYEKFQEGKEPEFWSLLRVIDEDFTDTVKVTEDNELVVDHLAWLGDLVAERFIREELSGQLDSVVMEAPYLSRKVDKIRSEHQELFSEVCDLCDKAERSICADSFGRTCPQLAADFHAFMRRLRRHEERETELIQESCMRDLGGVE